MLICVLQAAINALCQWADAWQVIYFCREELCTLHWKTAPSTPMSINGASLPYVS